jgi:hypothetical protein
MSKQELTKRIAILKQQRDPYVDLIEFLEARLAEYEQAEVNNVLDQR